jgi:hypothetical protein
VQARTGVHRLARCFRGARKVTMDAMTTTFRRFRFAVSGLVAEDRRDFKRLDASSVRYDDGAWLKAHH